LTAVATGSEALELVRQNKFSLIILDVKLAGEDGLVILFKDTSLRTNPFRSEGRNPSQ